MQGTIAKLQGSYRQKVVKVMDRRVTKTSELINAIRLIKMYAWEKPFLKKIITLKGEEMKELRKSGLLTSVTLTLSPSTSAIAPFFIFLTMTLAGVELDTTQAFTVLSIFNALQFSISTLPLTVRNITEAHISFKRFQEFLGIELAQYIIYMCIYNIHMIFIF